MFIERQRRSIRRFVCEALGLALALSMLGSVSASPSHLARAYSLDPSCATIRREVDIVSLTQTLFAPIYFAFGGYNSTVYIFNPSTSTVNVELDFDATNAATMATPYTAAVAAGKVVQVKVADFVSLSDAEAPFVLGGIRLRHDGADVNDIRAVVAVDWNGLDKAYSVAFQAAGVYDDSLEQTTYAAAYLGQDRTCYLALENTTDVDTWVEPTVNYETGTGTLTDSIVLPSIPVSTGRTAVVDLTSYVAGYFANASQGTWGTISIRSPQNAVIARTVTVRDNTSELAFDEGFVDPATAVSTTKIVSPIALDYDSAAKSYVMVRNLSASQKTVTAKLPLNSGTTTYTLVIDAGHQKLLTLDSQTLLAAHAAEASDLRLTYTGTSADIVAGAVSETITGNLDVPARLIETSPDDHRRLAGPALKLDGRTSSVIEIANISSGTIRVGARMHLTDSSVIPITSDLVAVPANGKFVIDLSTYLNQIPEASDALGAVELWHNGAAGSIAATCTTAGRGVNIAQVSAFRAGQTFPTGELIAFPNSVTATPNAVVTIGFLTDTGVPAPTLDKIPSSGSGTLSSVTSLGSNAYSATWTLPSSFSGSSFQVQAKASGGTIYQLGTITSQNTLATLSLTKFKTTDSAGVNIHKRMKPQGGTNFSIEQTTGLFPAGDYVVQFKVPGKTPVASLQINLAASSQKLQGVAPANDKFIGDVKTISVLKSGALYAKGQDLGGYYAYDPPVPSAVSPNSHD